MVSHQNSRVSQEAVDIGRMWSLWSLLALVALANSARHHNPDNTIPDDPASSSLMLFGFPPVERGAYFAWVTPANEDVTQRLWRILDPPLTAPVNLDAPAAVSTRGISATGKIREFRFYGISNSATDTTAVYICLLEPQDDGNYKVVLATMMPMVGRENTEFQVTQLESDFWDSTDDTTRPGMLMAIAVETSDAGNLRRCGVSFRFGRHDECGTTYAFEGDLQLGTTVQRSQMTAIDGRCLMMSLELVVDI